MTSRIKRSFFLMAGVFSVASLLWMRPLSYWRPAKIGEIPAGSLIYFLSNDAKTIMLLGSKFPIILNLKRGIQIKWPYPNSYPLCSPHSPNWTFTFAKDWQMQVRHLSTGQLKRTFRWPKARGGLQLVSDSDSDRVGIVAGNTFSQWSIETGRALHQIHFDAHALRGRFASYAISPDGKQLVGCADNRGCVWDTSSGKCLCAWKIRSYGTPSFFSNDAHTVAYTYTSSTDVEPPLVFVDTNTGKVKWQTKKNSTLYYRTGDELVLLDATGCNILDVNTGLPKRHLPGPRKEDNILRATPDYIYTLSDKREILRWRAR